MKKYIIEMENCDYIDGCVNHTGIFVEVARTEAESKEEALNNYIDYCQECLYEQNNSNFENNDELNNYVKNEILKMKQCRFIVNEDVEIRDAKILFAKNGNGFSTTRITLPVPWVKYLGFTDKNRDAKILFDGEKIIVEKR